MAEFAERLKELRIQKGVSQQELADYIGVNKQTISGYERGVRRPAGEGAKELYESIADYFNVDVSFLMGLSDVSVQIANPLDSEPSLTPHEKDLILAYRLADDGIKNSVCKLLDVKRGLKEVLDA